METFAILLISLLSGFAAAYIYAKAIVQPANLWKKAEAFYAGGIIYLIVTSSTYMMLLRPPYIGIFTFLVFIWAACQINSAQKKEG